MSNKVTADIEKILEALPHRYPFLMIDKVVDIVPGQSATGIKNVSINEPHFQGHFPGKPVMPGVLIIEAMAQTAGIVALYTSGKQPGDKLVYFMTIDEARFRKPVVPGDVLEIHVEKTQARKTVWKFRAEAKVEGQLVAEAVISAMIADS